MRSQLPILAAMGVVTTLSLPQLASALDFGGSIFLFATTVNTTDVSQDQLEQRYNFNLTQTISPYLTAFLGYGQRTLDATTDSVEFRRDSREPRFELRYNRPRMTGFVGVSKRTTKNEFPASSEAFDADLLRANFTWRPTKGPRFQVSYRDAKNVGDLDLFGRDSRQQVLSFETSYNRRFWGGSYLFQHTNLSNEISSDSTEQDRHELRLRASKVFLENRLAGSIATRLAQIDRKTFVEGDNDIADPIPAAQGLFVIDTSPELGELEPVPSLIDGDRETPASPPIDIGAANTFRNIGLDLGLTQPVSQLQIFVNNVSSPTVVWQVYSSADNLVWDRVDGTTSAFDQDFLRYTIRLPQTTARFFKAVNISSNAIPDVLVTEARALLDLEIEPGSTQFESKRYTASGDLAYQPSQRMTARLGFSATNDEDFAAGLVRQDYQALHATAGFRYGLARNLNFDLNYSYDNSENLRAGSPLVRTVNNYSAALRWTPITTVDAVLTAYHRDESQESLQLNSQQGLRLFASTDLLPDLRVLSNLSWSRFNDTLTGQDRDSWNWSETLQARPYENWRLGGTLSFTLYESLATAEPDGSGQTLYDRFDFRAFTTWSPTAFLSLSGSWTVSDLGGSGTVNQTYSISYNPGPKLALSAAYSNYKSGDSRGTSNKNLAANYRLTHFMTLIGSLSQSETVSLGLVTNDVVTARFGLRLFF